MNIIISHEERREKIMIKEEKKPIVILETKHADSRALNEGEELKKEDVEFDTKAHIDSVKKCGDFISEKIKEQFKEHDHTKLGEHLEEFTKALSSRKTNDEFKKLPWWKVHLTERHHLNDKAPNDVNLIDVLEMVCDCVSAGKARSGEVYPIEIDSKILQKAIKNTQKMLEDNIEVVSDEDEAKKLFKM